VLASLDLEVVPRVLIRDHIPFLCARRARNNRLGRLTLVTDIEISDPSQRTGVAILSTCYQKESVRRRREH
jgi:hypothetical protein